MELRDLEHAKDVIRQLSIRLRTAVDHVQSLTQEHLALKADHTLLSEMYQAIADKPKAQKVEPEVKKAKRKK